MHIETHGKRENSDSIFRQKKDKLIENRIKSTVGNL